jgi:uncharacterized protein YecT (DUF1311 family)
LRGGSGTAAKQTICGDATLGRLDTEMNALYASRLNGLNKAERRRFVAASAAWLRSRDDTCGSGAFQARKACLAEMMRARISALSQNAAAPDVRPDWCARLRGRGTSSERAICGDARLSRLDIELNALYTRKLNGLQGSARRNFVAASQAWVQARDSSCGGAFACLADMMRSRIQQLRSY